MRIGIDFDNTLVCYDRVFHRMAIQRDLIDAAVRATKAAVRDHLRRAGREHEWTALQGEVYGPRILEAEPFDGALAFMSWCRQQGVAVSIISHKTRHPVAGPRCDLHEAARAWLRHHRFIAAVGGPINDNDVHFELTRDAKLRRVASAGCTLFVDDLPEFLAESTFAAGVDRVLFDPNDAYLDEARFRRVRSWRQMASALRGMEVTR